MVGALATVAVIVALFVRVLLHEFGHSLVAQWLGIEIPVITLLLIGGVVLVLFNMSPASGQGGDVA